MKAVGIVRKVDLLGRVVIPAEIRRTLNVEVNDPMEIFMDNDKIVLRKYSPNCIFCGSDKDMSMISGRPVCKKCLNDIKDAAKK
ncbi:MAG: AbrB/MazE/SpoVT family DNA-binding domain-containing protein [Clostridiales Family XIII bacterium]|nr:AbrB/MazE/SpoVT family DNA-binding domain-containing protein [Clostridiales Family XIII bacterium]